MIHTGASSAIVIKGLAFTKGPKGWIVTCKKGAKKPTPSQVLDAALEEILRLRAKIAWQKDPKTGVYYVPEDRAKAGT